MDMYTKNASFFDVFHYICGNPDLEWGGGGQISYGNSDS